MTAPRIIFFCLIGLFLSLPGLAFPVSIPKDDLYFTKGNQNTKLDPESISVYSWNIYKGSNRGFKKDFLKFNSADGIFLFQEYYDSRKIDSSFKKLSTKNILIGISYEISLWGKTGLGIISSTIPEQVSLLRTKRTENFSLATYKASLLSTYKIKGSSKKLMVVNVHLLNSVELNDYNYELKRLSNLVLTHDGPLVVAGDFNNWPERQESLDQWANSLSLTKVIFNPDYRTNFNGNRIDNIYYRGLNLIGAWSQPVSSSDHNPIGARFKIISKK